MKEDEGDGDDVDEAAEGDDGPDEVAIGTVVDGADAQEEEADGEFGDGCFGDVAKLRRDE